MTVTAWPRIESPRNSRRSLWARPPCSYAYDRWVSASSSNSGSMTTPRTSVRFTPARSASSDTHYLARGRSCLNVGDLAALVLHVQGRAGGVLDDLRAVREA